ncbi:MAG: hypothetical protein JO296_11085 [Pseudonocardiales bacterium]|nr:hypothetical protein [Pseudonocardiales bacterium]MBV9650668.1 hypothetical protein [Pseudonocardiales bacterium]
MKGAPACGQTVTRSWRNPVPGAPGAGGTAGERGRQISGLHSALDTRT